VFDVLDLIDLRWVCVTDETGTHHRRCPLSVVDFSGVVVLSLSAVELSMGRCKKVLFSCVWGVGSGETGRRDVNVGVVHSSYHKDIRGEILKSAGKARTTATLLFDKVRH
jgi:hypothetical protein